LEIKVHGCFLESHPQKVIGPFREEMERKTPHATAEEQREFFFAAPWLGWLV
jgi:hypothetical protein